MKDEIDFLIEREDMGRAFERYFTFLWSQAIIIKKQGGKVNLQMVEKLEKEYGLTNQ